MLHSGKHPYTEDSLTATHSFTSVLTNNISTDRSRSGLLWHLQATLLSSSLRQHKYVQLFHHVVTLSWCDSEVSPHAVSRRIEWSAEVFWALSLTGSCGLPESRTSCCEAEHYEAVSAFLRRFAFERGVHLSRDCLTVWAATVAKRSSPLPSLARSHAPLPTLQQNQLPVVRLFLSTHLYHLLLFHFILTSIFNRLRLILSSLDVLLFTVTITKLNVLARKARRIWLSANSYRKSPGCTILRLQRAVGNDCLMRKRHENKSKCWTRQSADQIESPVS